MNNQNIKDYYEPISLKNYYYIAGSGALLTILGLTATTIGTFSDSLKEFISNEDLIKYGLSTFTVGYLTMLGSSFYYVIKEKKNRDNQSIKGLERRLL